MQKLFAIFHGYILVLGLTSYRLVNGRFLQTRLTKTYAWIVNLGLLTALPYCLWGVANYLSALPLLPRFIKIAPYVLNSINYVVIVYTMALRGQRDRIILDMHKLITQVNREMARSGKKTSSKLWGLLYSKIAGVVYTALSHLMSSFIYGMPLEFCFKPRISSLIVNIGSNLIVANVFLYFLAFWHIARGYDFINQRIKELIPHSESKKKELSRLWALHFKLSRAAKRIHDFFGPQLLAGRFNYFIVSVVNSFLGILFWKDGTTPSIFLYLWVIFFAMRTFGSFLIDYIVGLATEYQSKRRDLVTEEDTMSKETSAYIIYESTMKLDLKICGLFTVNQVTWLQMMELILSFFIVLLQFHLVLGTK
nr:putative gustatory receptor 59b [Drosophila kikkawai]